MGYKKLSVEDMEARFPANNREKYTPDWSTYISAREKMLFTCPVHGDFWQRAHDHAKGSGCRKCGSKSTGDKLRKSTEDFITRASLIHNGAYSYSKTAYVNGNTKVVVTCPTHGDYLVNPHVHLQGCLCPKCEREAHVYPGGVGQYNEKYFERNPEMKDHFGALYLVSVDSLGLVKLGITNDETLSKRFSCLRKETGSKVSQINLYLTTLYDAFRNESRLLKKYKRYRIVADVDFGGRTECFPPRLSDTLALEISALIYEREKGVAYETYAGRPQ